MTPIEQLLERPRFGPAGVNERMAHMTAGLEMAPTIKVVGSNGKGTTAHMMAQMALQLGKSVGLYTSPHILELNERIQINGMLISDDDLDLCLSWALARADEEAGRFEVFTLAALYYFSQQKVDVAVMEIGLGGRYDPVRIASGDISVLTSIDLEHTAILGDTWQEIAVEKAAVCKSGDTLLSAVSGLDGLVPDGVSWVDLSDPPLSPLQSNARLAAHAVRQFFNLDDMPQTAGVRLPGRMQKVSVDPTIYVDVAHTPQAIGCVSQLLNNRPVSLLVAVRKDKALKDMPGQYQDVMALSFHEEMHHPSDVLECFDAPSKHIASSIDEGLQKLTESLPTDGVIVCLGGFEIVGRVLSHFKGAHYDVIRL